MRHQGNHMMSQWVGGVAMDTKQVHDIQQLGCSHKIQVTLYLSHKIKKKVDITPQNLSCTTHFVTHHRIFQHIQKVVRKCGYFTSNFESSHTSQHNYYNNALSEHFLRTIGEWLSISCTWSLDYEIIDKCNPMKRVLLKCL